MVENQNKSINVIMHVHLDVDKYLVIYGVCLHV